MTADPADCTPSDPCDFCANKRREDATCTGCGWTRLKCSIHPGPCCRTCNHEGTP